MKTSFNRLHLFLIILILIIITFHFTNPARSTLTGKIIHVDDDNTDGPWDGTITNPFHNITTALNHALKGETILVHNGFYDENLNITKAITLIGENNTETIINSRNGRDTITISADKVTILNFTIQNATKQQSIAINIQSNNNLIFQNYFYNEEQSIQVKHSTNTIIKNNIFGNKKGMNHFPNFGILLWDSSHCLMENNSFYLIYGYGIRLLDSYDNLLVNNRFESSSGIRMLRSERNMIQSNLFRGTWWFGINLYSNNNTIKDNTFAFSDLIINGYYDNIIENNTIDDKPLIFLKNKRNQHLVNAGQIILYNCENISISQMNVKDHYIGKQGYIGIDLVNCNNCSIYDCIIADKTKYGVRLDQSSHVNIYNNTICLTAEYRKFNSDTHETGVYMSFCNQITICDNNISYNHRSGIITYDCSNITITDNIIFSNREYGIYARGSYNYFMISANSLKKNGVGIKIQGCIAEFLIDQNMVNDNQVYGMELTASSNLNIIDNTILNNNKSGLIITSVYKSNISRNIIKSNNLSGIFIEESNENNIKGNTIKNHLSALILFGNNNTVSRNQLQNHLNGFLIGGKNNTIEHNVIKTTLLKAVICNAFNTTWNHNYWNRPRLLPKIIMGIYFYFERSYWPTDPPIIIPLINFDRNPAFSPVS